LRNYRSPLKIIALLLLGILSPAACRDSWTEQAARLKPLDSSCSVGAVLDHIEGRALRSLQQIPHAATPEEARSKRVEIRAKLVRSLGMDQFPEKPELHARTVGTLDFDGYRLEKVVYETLPGVRVPAHLYLPEKISEPVPGIVFYPGHWVVDSKSRPAFQAFCINMARLGFAVLNFDPFGQGERGVSWRDHRRTSALLVGISQQGFAAYETRCAIDYIQSRKEVDSSRIGITGASGGGYNSWITAVLDDRIRVAVPVVGTSEFGEQIRVCRPLDWYHANEHCHYVPGLIRYANNHEFLASFAPKPLMIIAAVVDESFPIAGVREIYRYGKSLYRTFDAEERIGFFEDSRQSHGYQKEKREAAYGWFLKWMKRTGDGSSLPESKTRVLAYDDPELRCFETGKNQPAGPGYVDWIKRLAETESPGSPDDLQKVFGRPAEGAVPASNLTPDEVQRLQVTGEGDVVIPAFLYQPPGTAGLLVAIDDRGKKSVPADHLVLKAAGKGWAICGVDPRGIGELAVEEMGWVVAVYLLNGENFVWDQAGDVRRMISGLAKTTEFSGKPVVLYARGENAGLIAVYAAAQASQAGSSPIGGLVLRESFISFRHFIDRPKSMAKSFRLLNSSDRIALDREIPFHFFVFDVLRHFDLPGLLEMSSVPGIVIDPINGDREVMTQREAEELLPNSVRAGSPETVAQWLERLAADSGLSAVPYEHGVDQENERVIQRAKRETTHGKCAGSLK